MSCAFPKEHRHNLLYSVTAVGIKIGPHPLIALGAYKTLSCVQPFSLRSDMKSILRLLASRPLYADRWPILRNQLDFTLCHESPIVYYKVLPRKSRVGSKKPSRPPRLRLPTKWTIGREKHLQKKKQQRVKKINSRWAARNMKQNSTKS